MKIKFAVQSLSDAGDKINVTLISVAPEDAAFYNPHSINLFLPKDQLSEFLPGSKFNVTLTAVAE